MEYLTKNWIAILSLVVALIGGIPGIISVLNYFKDKPILSYRLVNLITGAYLDESSGEEKTILFLTGTLSNEGSKVLTPAYFELKGSLDGEKLKFEKRLIPENVNFGSDRQSILATDPSKNDLQKFNSTISTGIPLHGYLLFYTSDIALDKLQKNLEKLKLILVCIDVFEKKYKVSINLQLNNGGGVEYPKHGLKITTKPYSSHFAP